MIATLGTDDNKSQEAEGRSGRRLLTHRVQKESAPWAGAGLSCISRDQQTFSAEAKSKHFGFACNASLVQQVNSAIAVQKQP